MAESKHTKTSEWVVAAIDFGTAYMGYAYWLERAGDIDATDIKADKAWVDGSRGVQEVPTVLMDPNNEFRSFGRDAEKEYQDLVSHNEQKGWHYFRRIKMALSRKENLDEYTVIEDSAGKSLSAVPVFANAIKYTKMYIEQQLKREFGNRCTPSQIFWVIPVPSAWKDGKSLAFVKSAAAKAEITNNLSIVSEPEAIVQFYSNVAKYEAAGLDDKFTKCLKAGNQIIVVDIGADIVDTAIVCLRTAVDLELKETSRGTRGSERVNHAFAELITRLFEKDVTILEKTHREEFIEMMKTFEVHKRKFTLHDISNNKEFVITIPPGFSKSYSETRLTGRMDRMQLNDRAKILNNTIVISSSMMKEFFDVAITDIKKHVEGVLRKNRVACILVAGGFAESPVVRHALESHFKDNKIFIPDFGSIAVVKGAVMHGKHEKRVLIASMERSVTVSSDEA